MQLQALTQTPFSRLYINLLTDSLSEYSYDAEVAGLIYYLNQEPKGITVSSLFVAKGFHLLTFQASFMLVATATNCLYF